MQSRNAIVLAAALYCLCAAAAADITEPRSGHGAPPPPPAWDPTITPSRAIGDTRNCVSYYPNLSRRVNETGDVLVAYDIAADGAIVNVHLGKSSGSDRLDEAALTCVREAWRNTPAMKNGVPIASPDHQAIVRFSLHDAVSAEDYFEQGTTYEKMGAHLLAIAQFGQALLINPNYAEAYRARAKAYEAIGQTDFAKGDEARADMLDKGR